MVHKNIKIPCDGDLLQSSKYVKLEILEYQTLKFNENLQSEIVQ